jgi:protease-4
MDSFGFVEALDKLGVERRLLTAGEHKGFLDPFLPLREQEVQHVSGLLGEIHAQFIETVKAGRGKRLQDDPRLFSGYVWTGARAVELGLVDGLASAGTLARERFEAEDIVDFTPRENVVDALARRFGTATLQQVREWAQTPW